MSLNSENINEIMAALAKAQGIMEAAIKDSTNPHFKSKYADLASVWEACRIPLSTNGLAVTQTLDFAGEKQVLVTTLGHTSGQWIKSMIALPIQKPGAQELGSCLSYCRRYALAAMVGVYQDDDDAERAQTPYRAGNDSKQKQVVQENNTKKLTKSQIDELSNLIAKVNDENYIYQLTQYLKVDSIYEINSERDFARTVRALEQRIKTVEVPNGQPAVA